MKISPAQKAANKRKWHVAQKKAQKHARNAKTFAKYRLKQMGYKWIDFDSPKGHEGPGVVDLVGVKRLRENCLEIMLVQVKGGRARVKPEEKKRLRCVKLRVRLAGAEKPGRSMPRFFEL